MSTLKKGVPKTYQDLCTTWADRTYPEVNETYLFHGTQRSNIEGVCKLGLDAKMGHGKAVYGQAIYMAESSTKADQYTGK